MIAPNVCPICLGSKSIVPASQAIHQNVQNIAKDAGLETGSYCAVCFVERLKGKQGEFQPVYDKNIKRLEDIFRIFEVTTFPPERSDINIKGIITAQAAITPYSSFITEEFEKYEEQFKKGVTRCRERLIRQAFALGANTVAGVQISYIPPTSDEGKILVCMAGTAIEDSLYHHIAKEYNALCEKQAKLEPLFDLNL